MAISHRGGVAANGQDSKEHLVTGDNLDGLQPVVKFLQSALDMKAKGDGLHYQHLVAQLLTRDDPETLWRLYLGMCHCVTTIAQQPEDFKELIDAVFRFDWRAGDRVVEAFGSLLSHLVSANGTCMVPAMHMLVRSLVLTSADMDGAGHVDAQALTRQRRVHEALQTSLALVPSGRSKLFGVLRQHYPHRRQRAEVLSDYALQALRVVQYSPLIEESVVRLIVEKSVEIDVEIKITDNGEAVVDEEDEESDALFTMDDLVDGTADTKKLNNDEVDEMADKLDGVMLVLFTYLDQRLTANTALPLAAIIDAQDTESRTIDDGRQKSPALSPGRDSDTRNQEGLGSGQGTEPVARLLRSLLVVFEERILPTHRSKFVQFILFFACGRAPTLGYALSTKLMDVVRDDARPKLTRQSAVAYLASFIARGAFVDASLVSQTLGALLEWAASYLDEDSAVMAAPAVHRTPSTQSFQTPVARRARSRPQSWHGSIAPGIRGATGSGAMMAPMSATPAKSAGGRSGDHMLFYSVCQATFYVMCFRGLEIANMDGIRGQAEIWQRLLACPLYPLRHCLDTVRREFARLSCDLMKDYLHPDLLDQLDEIAEERSHVAQAVSIGSSLSFSTPLSVASTANGVWTPSSRVTRAGGLGRGSNPLDSFFPFDPYLLRRSHVFVDTMYNTWKGRNVRTPADGRPLSGDGDSNCSSDGAAESTSESDSDSDDEEDHVEANSLSFRDRASGQAGLRRHEGRRINAAGAAESDDDSSDESSRDTGVSRKMASTRITDSMSVTPASSVAVGSLMGRSLGKAMASSFADDGLMWGPGAGAGSVDDAFFHENVSPSASPPLASTMATRMSSIEIGVPPRRALF